jgi:saccharopine dehydrogenase (NAD+, L-lysine forming)
MGVTVVTVVAVVAIGGVGGAVSASAASRSFVEHLAPADYGEIRARSVVDRPGDPRLVLPLFRACLAVKVTYPDLAMSISVAHP